MMGNAADIVREGLERKYLNAVDWNADFDSEFLISVKDLIVTKGMETTASSAILKGWVPRYDATAVKRARNVGEIIGKTNCDEFGFGSFNLNSAFGIPENPVAESRVTGGSSGGSAALAYIMPENHVSLATSTGGSIENPSSFCSVIGFVPSYGAISRFGLISYSDSLDRIGLIGKSIPAIRKVFDAVRGKDGLDGTVVDVHEREKEPSSVGVVRELVDVANSDIAKAFWKEIDRLGIDVSEVSINIDGSLEAYYVIAMAEASTNLARYCGLRYGIRGDVEGKGFNEYFREIRDMGFGKEAKRRIVAGTYIRMKGRRERYFMKALKVRERIRAEFSNALKEVDMLANPTMPIFPPGIDEASNLSPVEAYRMDISTVPLAMSMLPHITIPMDTELPSGITFTTPYREDISLLGFAEGFAGA